MVGHNNNGNGRLPRAITSYFEIPLGSSSTASESNTNTNTNTTNTAETSTAHTPADFTSTQTQPRLQGPLRSPPPSVPYSPAFSEPRSRASGSNSRGGTGAYTPAFSDDEDEDLAGGGGGSAGSGVGGVKRVRSRSFRRRARLAAAAGSSGGSAGKSGNIRGNSRGNTRGLGLGMTGIVPPSTKTNMKLWGVSKWKGGRAVQGAGEEEDEDDANEKNGQGQEPASQTYTFGSHIVVEEGALLLTTSAAWEEAFHPTLGLMRRDRGGQRVELDRVLPDERLRTIGDDVEWLVLDLRFVMGSEEYKDEQALLGGGSGGADITGATLRPGLSTLTHRSNSLLATHAHSHSNVRSASTGSTSASETSSRTFNPACLPKVHKLTFLGSEYAETMSVSRAAEVKSIVQVLKGLLAVEWLPSNDDPMAGDNSSSFSPAPFTPSGSTRDNQYAGATVTFPTCLVPQDLIEAGKWWNVNWNRRPEGDDVFANESIEGEQQEDDDVVSTVRRPEQGDNVVPFPRAGVEPEQPDSIEADDTHRQSGHRFYSNVSEQHRQDVGTLSQVAISPLQWLGGLRCLKVQGGFPVPQPDESLGLVKPDYSFAFKTWIGENGVETLVWSFKGSYTETTTLTILKHLFKFITNRWIEVGKASSPDLRPACSLLVLQSVNPAIVAKLRNATDQLTRRRVGLRIDDDVPFHAFEWLRDVVFLEDKVMVEEEDREVPRLTRLWDTENEQENVQLDMDQVRAIVRLKAEVLAHARAGRGAKPRPVRSKRGQATKPPRDSGAFRERKGDLRLDLSERAQDEGGRAVPDGPREDVSSPPKTASTIRPLYRQFPLSKGNPPNTASPGMSRNSSYTSAPSVSDSIASLGSSASLGTIADDQLALSPRVATGENAAILAGDEEDEDDMCPTIRVDRVGSIKSPLS